MKFLHSSKLVFLSTLLLITTSSAQSGGECGINAAGVLCQQGFCCSKWGFCGTTDSYCSPQNCESQCPDSPPPSPPPPPPSPPPPPPPSYDDLRSLISNTTFELMFPNRSYVSCDAKGFYTYESFITAAASFPTFAKTGDINARKREIAAFFAQTSYENFNYQTFAYEYWGYCFLTSVYDTYCVDDLRWPCVPERRYYPRGPFSASFAYNYRYGPCGEALGLDLLRRPDLVVSDPIIAFKTALWMWMTPLLDRPSCHDGMDIDRVPTPGDEKANRVPGFGLTTNILTDIECGLGYEDFRTTYRLKFFRHFCDLLGVSYGENVDCENQKPFPSMGLNVATI